MVKYAKSSANLKEGGGGAGTRDAVDGTGGKSYTKRPATQEKRKPWVGKRGGGRGKKVITGKGGNQHTAFSEYKNR